MGKARAYVDALSPLLPGHGRAGRGLLRAWLRYPLEHRARMRLDAVPEQSLAQLAVELGLDRIELTVPGLGAVDQHAWSLHEIDRGVLLTIARAVGAKTAFEIGTFDGGTTLELARAIDPEGIVHTIDLPPPAFDRSQSPADFSGEAVGVSFRGRLEASRIKQHLGDSSEFDFSPWYGAVDLVFVDAAHDEPHGRVDALTALRLVRPGGVVIWDDFAPYWWGLVGAVIDVTQGLGLRRLTGTNLAYLRA